MRLVFVLILAASVLPYIDSRLLFPEEIVSFLSFVYSIIPPFKIGKDSRFGAGFRIGPNADFQVLVELGPQSETQPLGPDGSSTRQVRANQLSQTKNNQTKVGRRRKSKKKRVSRNNAHKNMTAKDHNVQQKTKADG